ncbi:MAG TPA: CheB methylesterase domain-containing protein [Terriglobales bacterium]|nr:CheB methylesterase domain-containing protein [Terriglobales bacterium]
MGPIDVIAIGASAGGPEALARLIPELPADFPVPIVIVQHLPVNFVPLLVERLDLITPLLVLQGRPGKRIGPGQIWIAPGNCHMTVRRQGHEVVIATNHDPEEQGCRPSVDVLFRSIAETFGASALAVVLTGMGADGTDGARAIREAGGEIFVQDQATSTVWGMPGRVVDAGFADRIYPLGSIAAAIVHRAFARRRLPESQLLATK